MGENVGVARLVVEPREAPAFGQVRHDETRGVVAVVAGDDEIGDVRRAMGDEFEPQWSDADPGAGRKLEVLGDPSVEHEAKLGIALVVELQRVAEPVIALFVEGVLG